MNRWRIFERDRFTCQYCGAQPPEAKLHVDHRQPRSKGGPDHHLNLITACSRCNQAKKDIVPVWQRCSPVWPDEGAQALETGFDQAEYRLRLMSEWLPGRISTGDFMDAEEHWGPEGVGGEHCLCLEWDYEYWCSDRELMEAAE